MYTTSAHLSSQPHVSDLAPTGISEISTALRELLADVFALYVKTKNFRWHMTGRHFRDFHLLPDGQADQVLAMIDPVAEIARKLGGTSLHSTGDISRNQRLQDNDAESVVPESMLRELLQDSRQLTKYLRSTHEICERYNDVATASLIENWIDEAELIVPAFAGLHENGFTRQGRSHAGGRSQVLVPIASQGPAQPKGITCLQAPRKWLCPNDAIECFLISEASRITRPGTRNQEPEIRMFTRSALRAVQRVV